MGLIETALDVAAKVVPPSEEDPHVHRWRLAVAAVTLLNASVLAVHITLACGLLPFYPGFVQAGDMAELQLQAKADAQAIRAQVATTTQQQLDRLAAVEAALKAQRISALKRELLELQHKRCTTPPGTAKVLYTSSIQEMRVEYASLTGTEYPLPGCDSF